MVIRRQSEAKDERPKTNDQKTTIKQKGLPRMRGRPQQINAWSARGLFLSSLQSLHPAVLLAVCEINHQPDHQPDDQSRPIDPTQFVHHVAVGDYAEDWDQWHHGVRKGRGWPGF